MPQQNIVDRRPLEAWQAEILRLTAFPSPAAQLGEPTWWRDLIGEHPETRISRPRRGGQQEEGRFEGRKLVLRVEPTRIDWLLAPIDDQAREVEGVPTTGPFPESLQIFLQLILRWFELETCPPVQRLAFGAILLLPVENPQAGYRQISTYLPLQLDPEGSSDFSYQINRPRDSTSGISSLKINRLAKWSVLSLTMGELSLGPTSVDYSARQIHHVCRLELDINTALDFRGELSREQLPQIFQELVNLGQEIVREGDIP
jgi:hypothetical protein